MPTSVKQLLEAANAAVPRVTPAQAKEMIGKLLEFDASQRVRVFMGCPMKTHHPPRGNPDARFSR